MRNMRATVFPNFCLSRIEPRSRFKFFLHPRNSSRAFTLGNTEGWGVQPGLIHSSLGRQIMNASYTATAQLMKAVLGSQKSGNIRTTLVGNPLRSVAVATML